MRDTRMWVPAINDHHGSDPSGPRAHARFAQRQKPSLQHSHLSPLFCSLAKRSATVSHFDQDDFSSRSRTVAATDEVRPSWTPSDVGNDSLNQVAWTSKNRSTASSKVRSIPWHFSDGDFATMVHGNEAIPVVFLALRKKGSRKIVNVVTDDYLNRIVQRFPLRWCNWSGLVVLTGSFRLNYLCNNLPICVLDEIEVEV